MASPVTTPSKQFGHDVHMVSPPVSPSKNPQGSSRATGGILRGRAFGNVFNLADRHDFENKERPLTGKVFIYTAHTPNVSKTAPFTVFKHTVVGQLAPILEKLSHLFPNSKYPDHSPSCC